MSKKKFESIFKLDQAISDFPDGQIEDLFIDPPQGDRDERFAIYGEGYGVRSRDSMEEVFEVLARLMGEERWLQLGRAYVEANPSKFYNLSDVGMHLPSFMAQSGYEEKWVSLAELELLVWKSFHAKRSPSPALLEFSKISDSTRFDFRTSTFLFHSEFRCGGVWRDRKLETLDVGDDFSVVFRKDFVVFVEPVTKAEFDLLKFLSEGHTLGGAIDRLSVELNQERLAGWLRTWCQREYFGSFKRDS